MFMMPCHATENVLNGEWVTGFTEFSNFPVSIIFSTSA